MFQISPDWALALVAGGALGLCWEFIRPGSVLPAVAGCLLLTWGFWTLGQYPLDWRGIALALAAFSLIGLEARYRLRGVAALGGAVALAAGLRNVVVAPKIHWVAAAPVAAAFSALMSFLLSIAWRARANKRTIF